MKIYVLTGPTLSAADGRQWLDAVYLPPAAQGDVYRVALEKPKAIGIIDGYFERVPSVSHKEILWAMAQGIHVFGASSMGALRAAELAPFGMEGVGEIYEAYRRGDIDADDEVAIAHAHAEDGYRALSEALVNIRATLQAAERASIIKPTTRARLEEIGRSLFYPERSYPLLLRRARLLGVPTDELDGLEHVIREARVDLKRLDAIALLQAMAERLSLGMEPKRVEYHFAPTDAWEGIRKRAELSGSTHQQPLMETNR